jgi:soluble lytic murein transglycosylase-like protein
MATPDLIARAVEAARKYGLDPSLFLAVIEQESSWNPWSIRYEPLFLKNYLQGPTFSSLSPTELQARATSWGLCQVMGQVAREFGFQGKFLSELCNPEVGLEIGAKVLADKLRRAKGDERQGLLRWNGGADESYPDKVLARRHNYAAEVTA